MTCSIKSSSETQTLLYRLRAFCFPGGENTARCVRGVRTTQRGESRTTPEARWIPFTAEEIIDATRSRFRWEARIGEVTFIDAYDDAHGLSAANSAAAAPMQKVVGPAIDQAELQRYLASIPACPSILLNHPSLEWTAVAPFTLRVRDREDPTAATIDLDINDEGWPLACRAERARMVGKQTVLTQWSGLYISFRQWEGIQVADRTEVSWRLPAGEFSYFRSHVTSLEALNELVREAHSLIEEAT